MKVGLRLMAKMVVMTFERWKIGTTRQKQMNEKLSKATTRLKFCRLNTVFSCWDQHISDRAVNQKLHDLTVELQGRQAEKHFQPR